MTRYSIATTALVLVALSTSLPAEAFAPPFVPANTLMQGKTMVATTRQPTGLHMNLFDRFSRVAKANLNNVLKNLEDPEKILNQAMEDMQVRRLNGKTRDETTVNWNRLWIGGLLECIQ